MTGPVEARLNLAHMIVSRMERLSADSSWAHISSGFRGSILNLFDRLDHVADVESISAEDVTALDQLIDHGLDLLAGAAREIGDPELLHFATENRSR